MKTKHPTALIAAMAGLMTLAALPAVAADQQRQDPQRPGQSSQQQDRGRGDANSRDTRTQDDRYGAWSAGWGARPPAPPRSFTRANDWHRHVRACQQRYRSYNAATDRYTVRRGQTAVCRL